MMTQEQSGSKPEIYCTSEESERWTERLIQVLYMVVNMAG